MKGTLDLGSVRAVLRVRTLAPYGFSETQTEIMDRLQTLREDGPITELDIDVWGATMGADRSDDSAVSPERQRVAEFEQWATDHDCTLRPAFDRRTSSSLLEQDDPKQIIVLPLICLGIYEERTVQAVYPHVDREEVYTIHDGVEALESMRKRSEDTPTDPIQTEEGLRPVTGAIEAEE